MLRDLAVVPGAPLVAYGAGGPILGVVGFERHHQIPDDGEPGYVGLRSGAAEVAITDNQWATDRYGMTMGDGTRVEMHVYVDDLDAQLRELRSADVVVLKDTEDMPWGERFATVADREGNPVSLSQVVNDHT